LVLDKDGILADLSFFAFRAEEQAVDFATVVSAGANVQAHAQALAQASNAPQRPHHAPRLDSDTFFRLLLHVFGEFDTICDGSIYNCRLRREDVTHMAATLHLDLSRLDCPLYLKLGYFATQLPLVRRNPYILFFLDADISFAGQLTLNPFTRALKAAYKVDSETLTTERKAMARALKHSLQQFSPSDFLFLARVFSSRGRRQREVAAYLRFAGEHASDIARGPLRQRPADSTAAGKPKGPAGPDPIGPDPTAAGPTDGPMVEEVIAQLPHYQFNRKFSREKDVEEDDDIGFDRYGAFLPRREADEMNKIQQGLHGAVVG